MLRLRSEGDYKELIKDLEDMGVKDIFDVLDQYGQIGVDALAGATPVDTGLSAASWNYNIINDERAPGIEWTNSNVIDDGTPVVILLQYGHATEEGGWVMGQDFINPAIRPIFDQIQADVWKQMME